jgi:NAD(P)-dependent dehydrogenase (short-subunit alcohol dehydrogenase family)
MNQGERSAPGADRPLAFVTGGSSAIGFELAKQLAQHGHDVAISGSSERAHTSAESLRELGVDAWSHQADAGTYDGVEAFWRFVEDLGRPVDVAVLKRRHRQRRSVRRHRPGRPPAGAGHQRHRYHPHVHDRSSRGRR